MSCKHDSKSLNNLRNFDDRAKLIRTQKIKLNRLFPRSSEIIARSKEFGLRSHVVNFKYC